MATGTKKGGRGSRGPQSGSNLPTITQKELGVELRSLDSLDKTPSTVSSIRALLLVPAGPGYFRLKQSAVREQNLGPNPKGAKPRTRSQVLQNKKVILCPLPAITVLPRGQVNRCCSAE